MERGWLDLLSKVNRPSLGEDIPILIFRAFRIYSGEYLQEIMGDKGATVLFQNAGRELGKSVGEKIKASDINSFLDNAYNFVKEAKIGILIPEKVDSSRAVIKIDECITCSGFPNLGKRICHFEAGFVGGLFESFLGKKKVKVTETKCNANGEGVCEVTVEVKDAQG